MGDGVGPVRRCMSNERPNLEMRHMHITFPHPIHHYLKPFSSCNFFILAQAGPLTQRQQVLSYSIHFYQIQPLIHPHGVLAISEGHPNPHCTTSTYNDVVKPGLEFERDSSAVLPALTGCSWQTTWISASFSCTNLH